MKTRIQIIEEVLSRLEEIPTHHQLMAVSFALKSMPDANLFILAQDLGIILSFEQVRS